MKKFTCTIIIALALHGAANAEKLYFYTGKKYGYEYVFNPLNLIFNAGFDILQCREGDERDLFSIPYGRAMDNMLMNLKNPAKAIGVYGPKAFVMEEVFPLTFSENARWWPNYQLHFIGGCVTFTYLHDYFAYHGYENPDFFAALAYWAFHFTNEVVENNYRKGYTCDAVADIYIFDIAGMLMGLSPKARRFFSKKLNMADWSMQPMFIGDDLRLENAGQYYSIKWLLPFSENRNWHLFYYWGLNFVLGLSYKFDRGYALSFGAGIRSKGIKLQDFKTGKSTMVWVYTGGIFLDKNNSLLASLIVNVNYYEAVQLNIYPGLFPDSEVSPGVFLAVSEDLSMKFGILFNYTFSESLYRGKLHFFKHDKLARLTRESI